MSSNLVKQIFTVVSSEDKRMIDTNHLMKQRLDEFEEKQKSTQGKGFVAGLMAEEVSISSEGEEQQPVEESSKEYIARVNAEAERILAQAREQAEMILAQANTEAERIKEETASWAEQEKKRVTAQAEQDGYAQGQNQARQETLQIQKEYEEKVNELENYYQQRLEIMEPELVEVITDIYRHILNVDMNSYKESLAYLISAAMIKNDNAREFLIHVSKDDFPFVSMQKKQITAGVASPSCHIEFVEDILLGKNECMIETENGIIDCGLGTQLEELTEKIRVLSWAREA